MERRKDDKSRNAIAPKPGRQRHYAVWLAIAVCSLASLILPPLLQAHPLGNFSINQYLLLNLRGNTPEIYYLLDMAEIPSFPELDLIDADFDSLVTDTEEETYLNAKVPELTKKIHLKSSGRAIGLRVADRRLSLQEGSGGMIVINILVKLLPSKLPLTSKDLPVDLEIVSENYINDTGVRELKVFLGKRYGDQTRQLGRDILGYQTEIFVDRAGNPVYEDFDCQFTVRLTSGKGETPLDEEIPLGFSWSRTARTSTDSGDNITWGKAFSDFNSLDSPSIDVVPQAEDDPVDQDRAASAVPKSAAAPLAPLPMPAAEPAGASAGSGLEAVNAEPEQAKTMLYVPESGPAEPGPRPVLTRQGNGQQAKAFQRAPPRPTGAASEGVMAAMFNRVTDLIRTPEKELTPAMFLIGLAVAMALGMAHARSPGHGKTIMAAYLIGERGTAWNAIVLGIVVTITHTWSVILLGLVTLSATESVSEEQLSFWLGIASGLIIIIIGIVLFMKRYKSYLLDSRASQGPAFYHHHEHSPSDHSHAADHHHDHGPGGHSHVIQGKDGSPPSYWYILWLGVSGGIVPCPSALIVLLLALRFGRLQYGLWLILSFSFGLALVLILIGLLVVYASDRLQRIAKGEKRWFRILPVFSSAMIAILGVWVIIWTLLQYEVIRL